MKDTDWRSHLAHSINARPPRESLSLPAQISWCISPARIGTILVCVLAFIAVPARAQISPGPLSKAHSSLSGTTQCIKCHGVGLGKAELKCLDCHTEIRQRIAQGRGYHARILSRNASGKDCVPCHSEHNGEDFGLIRWEPSQKQFDHSKTGYFLEGRHAALECNQCHKPEHIGIADRKGIVVRDLNRSFLGLSRDCLSCHVDEHHGQLGTDCLSCHSMAGWKPAAKFDHAQSKYRLTGAHERVACQKCHTEVKAPKPYAKYVGIPFQNCVSCHTDPHKGAFAMNCQTCHNTSSWKQAHAEGKFDHSTTKFPLLGKHEPLACEKCHHDADFKKPIPHAKCADCHTPDPHHGQFKNRKQGGECAECHNVNGFKPSLFTVAMHAETKYPLDGQHEKVECDKCHTGMSVQTVFKITDTKCIACHADVHKGRFAGPPHSNRCEDCHNVQGFRSAKFTLAQHNTTRFPLTGAHVAVTCVECHKVEHAGTPRGTAKLVFDDLTCTGCHDDPHQGQFTERMAVQRANGTAAGCEACHNIRSWKISGFDHSTTTFPLVGAHRAAPCISCHHPRNLETTMRNVHFREAPKRCEQCHEDVHAGQFSQGNTPPDCSTCHNSAKWRPSLFDHEKGATFSLKGAHERVPCASCHTTRRLVNGVSVVFYKSTPKLCSECHK